MLDITTTYANKIEDEHLQQEVFDVVKRIYLNVDRQAKHGGFSRGDIHVIIFTTTSVYTVSYESIFKWYDLTPSIKDLEISIENPYIKNAPIRLTVLATLTQDKIEKAIAKPKPTITARMLSADLAAISISVPDAILIEMKQIAHYLCAESDDEMHVYVSTCENSGFLLSFSGAKKISYALMHHLMNVCDNLAQIFVRSDVAEEGSDFFSSIQFGFIAIEQPTKKRTKR